MQNGPLLLWICYILQEIKKIDITSTVALNILLSRVDVCDICSDMFLNFNMKFSICHCAHLVLLRMLLDLCMFLLLHHFHQSHVAEITMLSAVLLHFES
jgi:hypothetical protein